MGGGSKLCVSVRAPAFAACAPAASWIQVPPSTSILATAREPRSSPSVCAGDGLHHHRIICNCHATMHASAGTTVHHPTHAATTEKYKYMHVRFTSSCSLIQRRRQNRPASSAQPRKSLHSSVRIRVTPSDGVLTVFIAALLACTSNHSQLTSSSWIADPA